MTDPKMTSPMFDPETGWPIVGRLKCYCIRKAEYAKKVRDSAHRVVKVEGWCAQHVPKYIREEMKRHEAEVNRRAARSQN
jgi:hypothetical protein